MNSCSQLDSVDTLISSISFYRCLIFSSYQNFILGTGLFKKALSDPPPPPIFRQSTLKFCNWFQMDLITWFYSPKSRWREAFWDDFFWEVDILLKPSLFVGRGTYKDCGSDIITLNWSLFKSTYVWGHCAVQIVSWLVLHGGASQKF